MASLVTIFAAFIAISIISAGSAAVIPLASRVIPGIDSPPAFVASCQPSDIIYYNIWDQLFIFNITTNVSSSIYSSLPGRYISYVAPSCTPSGILYFAVSSVADDPVIVPKVYTMQSITRRWSSAVSGTVTQTSNYGPDAVIPSRTMTIPFIVFGESAYHFANDSGSYKPVRASHPAVSVYLWNSSHPLVQYMFDKEMPTKMSAARDVLSFTLRNGSAIDLAFANISRTLALPNVLNGTQYNVRDDSTAGRAFMTEIFDLETLSNVVYYTITTAAPVSEFAASIRGARIRTLNADGSITLNLGSPVNVILSGIFNASLSDIIRDSFDAIPVINKTIFFFATSPSNASTYLVAIDAANPAMTTTGPASMSSTAMRRGILIPTAFGYFVHFGNVTYKLQRDGISSMLSNSAGVVTIAPPFARCNNELTFSGTDSSGGYSVLVTKIAAASTTFELMPQGPAFSRFGYPAPLSADISETECLVACWQSTSGWSFVRYSTATGRIVVLNKRLNPSASAAIPGAPYAQSAIYLCSLFSGAAFTLESSRSRSERFSRLGTFRNFNSISYYPADADPSSEVSAVGIWCGSSQRYNDTVKFALAQLAENSAYSFYALSTTSPSTFGVVLPLVSNSTDSFAIYTGSLLSLRGSMVCFAAPRPSDSSGAAMFCLNSTSPSTTIYQAADLRPLFSYGSPALIQFDQQTDSAYYFTAGSSIIQLVQSPQNYSDITVSIIPTYSTRGDIDYLNEFKASLVFLLRNSTSTTFATLQRNLVSVAPLCPSGADVLDFARNDHYLFFSCQDSASSLSLWARSNLTSAPIRIDSFSCSSQSYCKIFTGVGIFNRLIYAFFDLGFSFEFKAVVLPETGTPVVTQFYRSASPSEVSITPKVSASGWALFPVAYFYNDNKIYVSDGVDFLVLGATASESYSQPRMIVDSDRKLRFYWNPRRRAGNDLFYRLIFTDPFCWDDSSCPPAFTCLRPQCLPVAQNCPQPPPTSTAVCSSTGWIQNGNLVIGGATQTNNGNSTAPTGSQVIIISSPVTISGNLVIQGSNSTPLTIQLVSVNATIIASGCLSVAGASLLVSVGSETSSGANITAITFDGGYCNSNVTRFDTIVVQRDGAPKCEEAVVTPYYQTKSLDIVVQFRQDSCSGGDTNPAVAAADAGFQLWIIGPIAGGIVALVIITLVIIFLLRRRIVPVHKMSAKAKGKFGSL